MIGYRVIVFAWSVILTGVFFVADCSGGSHKTYTGKVTSNVYYPESTYLYPITDGTGNTILIPRTDDASPVEDGHQDKQSQSIL